MANKQSGNVNSRQSRNDDEVLQLRPILINYLRHWPIFVVCFVLAMAGAFIYYQVAKPVYQVSATLVIQSADSKPNEQKSTLVEFQELDKANAPKVVENEIEILKSYALVKDVVDNFQLWTTYNLKDGLLNNVDLYGINPVRFNLYHTTGVISSHAFNLKILDSNTYELLNGDSAVNKHRFGDTVTNSTGSWSITANNNINTYVNKTIQIGISDPEATILGYQNSLNVEAKEKPATVIDISINDQNIKRGEDFINYLIYFYKQAEILEKNKIAKSTLAFINRRLDSISGQLNHAENNLAGYRSGKGITDVGAQSQIYLQEVQSNGEKLNEINIQLNVINNLEDYVENSADKGDTNIPSTLGITDQRLVELVQKLSDLQLEKSKLLATLPEKNPAFEPLDRQIATVKLAIREDIQNIKSSLTATRKTLESYRSNFQSSIQSVPGQERELSGLDRQQTSKQSLYAYLLQKREEISLTYASSSSDVRLVDAAYVLPLKLSKKLAPLGFALILGLIFPAGFIYSKDLIKNSITSRREIEGSTSIPVIAEFSYIKLPAAIVIDSKNSKDNFMLIEQFRHLRTQLNFLVQPIAGGKVTLVTSSTSAEGKSFVSSNLAVSLARSGKKTILLGTDIYKPKTSKMFNLPGSTGLAEYLSGKYVKADIIQIPAAFPNLHIIASGSFIDNFSELLDQAAFRTLLAELKMEYDHILIDTPPLHEINDAYIIAPLCDATLFLVRYNYTSKALLPFIQKLYNEEKLPNMNIVFNGVTAGRDSEGYKYENYYKG